MVSNPILFTIVICVALAIGGIGVGIYVASFNSKPENKNKKYSVVAISFILLASLLAGIVVCLILYAVRKPEKQCPTCGWGEDDIKMVKQAQQILEKANKKVQKIPRDMQYVTHCEAGEEECGVKVTPNMLIQKTEAKIPTEPRLAGKETSGIRSWGMSEKSEMDKISEKVTSTNEMVSKLRRDLEERMKSK